MFMYAACFLKRNLQAESNLKPFIKNLLETADSLGTLSPNCLVPSRTKLDAFCLCQVPVQYGGVFSARDMP